MAPVLQCPECGYKHPLARVPDQGAFACEGCGRVLKVPEQMVPRAAPGAAAAAVGTATRAPAVPPVVEPVAPAATRALPVVDQQPAVADTGMRPAAPTITVPWWMRGLFWIIAVPVSFVVVFEIARAFGLFTNNQLSDLFLANGTSRFWPVARLLPFVALLTALIVQGGVYLVARLRRPRP